MHIIWANKILMLLSDLMCQLTAPITIGLDNQVVVLALNNQLTKPSHYLLDLIHSTTKNLHGKQDKIQNSAKLHKAKCLGRPLTTKIHSIVDLKIQWVPGHVDFSPTKKPTQMPNKRQEETPAPTIPFQNHSKRTFLPAFQQSSKPRRLRYTTGGSTDGKPYQDIATYTPLTNQHL